MRYRNLADQRIWTFTGKTRFDGDAYLLQFAAIRDDGGQTLQWVMDEDLGQRDTWHALPPA